MKIKAPHRSGVFWLKTLPFLWPLVAGWLLTGCISEVDDPKLPEGPSKLVLAAFISPEVPETKVFVSRSASIFSPENNGQPIIVSDATVLLTDGIDTVQLPYIFNRQIYATSNFTIQPGRQYWLKVTTGNGLKAEATCTVPAKINRSLAVRIDSVQETSELEEWIYQAVFEWQDLAGEGDFYKIDAGLVLAGELVATDTVYLTQEMADEAVVRDYQADGRKYSIRSVNLPDYQKIQRNGRLLYLQTYLLTTDKPMFEYHRSLLRYQQSNSLTDPMQLYSNVKGGFGVFGAYRKFDLKVAVR